MNEIIETIEGVGISGHIYYDNDPSSPRDWDNRGTMVCWHSHYDLGDEQPSESAEDYMEDITEEKYIILPLYLYDHSGISISTGSFSCPWDSGQVGFIYVSRADACKEYGWKRISKQREAKIIQYLENEVTTYDEYLTGQVFGFCIEDKSGEILESCWGFYGIDDIKVEVERIVDHFVKERAKSRIESVKVMIRNHVPLGLRFDLLPS